MNETTAQGPRRRGRDAKRISRTGTVSHAPDIVVPGLPGGTYRPLSDDKRDRIIDAAIRILEDYGLKDFTPSMKALFLAAGATLKDDRIRISRRMVARAGGVL